MKRTKPTIQTSTEIEVPRVEISITPSENNLDITTIDEVTITPETVDPDILEEALFIHEDISLEESPVLVFGEMSRSKVLFIQNLLPAFPNVTLADIQASKFSKALSTLLKIPV